MQEVIKPNTVKRITGYGLPLPKDPSRKGDMLVAFEIKFPDKLTASEKEVLSDVLPSAQFKLRANTEMWKKTHTHIHLALIKQNEKKII